MTTTEPAFTKPTQTQYVRSLPGAPKVHPESQKEAFVTRESDQQVSPLLRSIRKTWDDDKRKAASSKRRLESYNPDERRVLEVRCYHARHVYNKDVIETSALLDLHPDDVDTLWKPNPASVFIPVELESCALLR